MPRQASKAAALAALTASCLLTGCYQTGTVVMNIDAAGCPFPRVTLTGGLGGHSSQVCAASAVATTRPHPTFRCINATAEKT